MMNKRTDFYRSVNVEQFAQNTAPTKLSDWALEENNRVKASKLMIIAEKMVALSFRYTSK